MQTDKTNKIFSILKNTPHSLILRNDHHKFYRKTYLIHQHFFNTLLQRQKLLHPNLINIHQIQLSNSIDKDPFEVQILFQYYSKTLNQCILNHSSSWQDNEIISTFQPIIDVVEYMINQNVVLHDFSLKNIAVTENQDIKYIDSFIPGKQITQLLTQDKRNSFNQKQIYSKIAESIFNIAYPKQTSKSWSNRLKILKERNSKQLYELLIKILLKSSIKGPGFEKRKKIQKDVKPVKNKSKKIKYTIVGQNIKQDEKDKERSTARKHKNYLRQQGKQNKLQQ